jgi:predicted dehydrogenase
MQKTFSSHNRHRIGVLGAGAVAQINHLPILTNMPQVRVEWVCDRVLNRAKSVAGRFGIASYHCALEDCPDVDSVLVAVPVGQRRQLLQHIFSRGSNILCEKPFAASLSEHDWILSQAQAAGVRVGVGLMRRFYQGVSALKQIVAGGVFGDLQEVWAAEGRRMRGTGRDGDWYQSRRDMAGGGIFIETGSHLVDELFYILDACSFEINSYEPYGFGDMEYEARATGTLLTSKEQVVRFSLAVSRINDLYNGLVLRFPNALLKMANAPDSIVTVCDADGVAVANLNCSDIEAATDSRQAFFLEWKEFIRECAEKCESRISAQTARLSTAFIEQCYRLSDVIQIEDF